ncbi:MAG: FKBP-type peptidyl-prolyl cis-trans isomerase [Kofleriaceae bacterium]
MSDTRSTLVLIAAILAIAGCRREDKPERVEVMSSSGSGSGSARTMPRATSEQVTPPFDIKQVPADATKTASGLAYKKLITNDAGAAPKRNDTVLVNYTSWSVTTGLTVSTNRARGQPMTMSLATAAPAFTEAFQLMKKGERAVLWVPKEIGYRGTPPKDAETRAYEFEIVDIVAAPAVPTDVANPPADASKTKSGIPYVTVRPGTGKEKPKNYDTVTFQYSAWGADGVMFDSTETRKRPATVPPYRQSPVMEEVLTSMVAGERRRFWAPADKLKHGGRSLADIPQGVVCYELELLQIAKGNAPPPTPPDVAKPPASAKKTDKGVFYRVLKAGKGGPKPTAKDSVKVEYSGWTTDGRIFDSSVIKGEPGQFRLDGVIAGWTDGMQLMSVGDKMRFWIPEQLAYAGAPGKPQGMLVFDVELLEIKPQGHDHDHDHDHDDDHGDKIPPPIDVAAPPKDAKKSTKGVFYKILKPVRAGATPKPTDRVKVNYTGWTTDGLSFDSSSKRGKPAEFSLQSVIEGWTDAIPLLKVGEKARLWIPEELAYKGRPGKPKGMLVFDVELIEIVSTP